MAVAPASTRSDNGTLIAAASLGTCEKERERQALQNLEMNTILYRNKVLQIKNGGPLAGEVWTRGAPGEEHQRRRAGEGSRGVG